MEMTIRNTVEDWLEFNRYHYRNSKALLKQRIFIRLLGPILFAIFIVLHSYYKGYDTKLTIGFAVLSVLWIIFYPKRAEAHHLNSVKEMLLEGKNRELNTDIFIKLTDKDMVVKSESICTSVRWSSVEKIIMHDDYLFVYISAVPAQVIPKRYFKDDKEFLELYKLLLRYKEHDLSTAKLESRP